MIADNVDLAKLGGTEIHNQNNDRREIDASITEEALAMIAADRQAQITEKQPYCIKQIGIKE